MELETAVEQAVENGDGRNFNQSIDMIINFTDVDLSDPENRINDDLKLPYQASSDVKVAVIGDTLLNNTDEADIEITENELEEMFDEPNDAKDLAEDASFILAEAPLMPKIGQQLGQVFGPRDMMPDPMPPGSDPTDKIKGLRSTISLRLKEDPLMQLKIGEEDQDFEEIQRNAQAVLDFVEGQMPKGSNNIDSVLIKTTMGKPVEVDA